MVLTDLESALARTVATQALGWAETRVLKRAEGTQLLLDLVSAEANAGPDGRLAVALGVKATLRGGAGEIAHKEVSCRESGLATSANGAQVAQECMLGVGRDLSRWLKSLAP
jgi:hypothetical protein